MMERLALLPAEHMTDSTSALALIVYGYTKLCYAVSSCLPNLKCNVD